ncbi:hypothetical protein [uncultured Flavobacterium sp.]|uniref:type II toxin-antitoxin system RelE/ParE family toxin n=1 Tax=uncultured Flavobacterium sp. TaxID=165435 RepID=UPI0025FD4ACC|nr:hypothetical protein [uncultured Flavobacterium sp.]
MEIVWSEAALNSFLATVDYLFEKWSIKEINFFEKNVDDLLKNILINNELCPESKIYGYRKCSIDGINSLVYSIVNNTLFLVTFLDNRSSNLF